MTGPLNAETRSFPDSRVFTMDVCELGRKKHHVAALLEIDVTDAREWFKLIKERDGESLSFSAWLIKCISMAVNEHKEAHAFLKNRKSMLIFDEIDVSLTVEKQVQGYRVPLPYVIRATNKKSLLDIHREIRGAAASSQDEVVIGRAFSQHLLKLFLALPPMVRRFAWKSIVLRPFAAKRNMGSVMFTSVGMFGSLDGWLIPTSIHPLCFAVGSTVKKPGIFNDQVAVREYLKMTVLIDHDVMDGAPAARFLSRLEELLRSASGLEGARLAERTTECSAENL